MLEWAWEIQHKYFTVRKNEKMMKIVLLKEQEDHQNNYLHDNLSYCSVIAERGITNSEKKCSWALLFIVQHFLNIYFDSTLYVISSERKRQSPTENLRIFYYRKRPFTQTIFDAIFVLLSNATFVVLELAMKIAQKSQVKPAVILFYFNAIHCSNNPISFAVCLRRVSQWLDQLTGRTGFLVAWNCTRHATVIPLDLLIFFSCYSLPNTGWIEN